MRLRRGRRAPSQGRDHRAAAFHDGAERNSRERTDTTGPPPAAHHRGRCEPPGRERPDAPGPERKRSVHDGDRRRAALARGEAPDDPGRRWRPCSQPHAGTRTPSSRPRRPTPERGKDQNAHPPDPCDTAARDYKESNATSIVGQPRSILQVHMVRRQPPMPPMPAGPGLAGTSPPSCA